MSLQVSELEQQHSTLFLSACVAVLRAPDGRRPPCARRRRGSPGDALSGQSQERAHHYIPLTGRASRQCNGYGEGKALRSTKLLQVQRPCSNQRALCSLAQVAQQRYELLRMGLAHFVVLALTQQQCEAVSVLQTSQQSPRATLPAAVVRTRFSHSTPLLAYVLSTRRYRRSSLTSAVFGVVQRGPA